MEDKDPLTERIIGCAIAVHRAIGPGLLEKPYHKAMCLELQAAGLTFERERLIPLIYRDQRIGEYHPDLIVESQVVVELKSVQRNDPVFAAQILTYLRVTGLRRGLLLNFGRALLKDGIERFVL